MGEILGDLQKIQTRNCSQTLKHSELLLLGKKLQILAPKPGFLKLALGCTFDCEPLFRKMAPNCLRGVRMA